MLKTAMSNRVMCRSKGSSQDVPKDAVDTVEAEGELSNTNALVLNDEVANRDGVSELLACTGPQYSVTARALANHSGRHTENETRAVFHQLKHPGEDRIRHR